MLTELFNTPAMVSRQHFSYEVMNYAIYNVLLCAHVELVNLQVTERLKLAFGETETDNKKSHKSWNIFIMSRVDKWTHLKFSLTLPGICEGIHSSIKAKTLH